MELSKIPNIKNLDSNNFFLLAGPCAIESEEMAMQIAEKIVEIIKKNGNVRIVILHPGGIPTNDSYRNKYCLRMNIKLFPDKFLN